MRYLGKGSVSSFLGVCLNIAWYVCIIAMAAILIAALVIGILIPHALNNSHFSLQIDGPILSFNLPSTVIKNPQALVFSGMALGFVMLGFALGIIHQLRRVFASLKSGKPFSEENARYIRMIGLLSITGSVVYGMLKAVFGLWLMHSISIPGVDAEAALNPDLTGIFAGLVFLVLGEVFRIGAKMQEEQDLTV